MSTAQWTVVLMATGGGLTWATFIAGLLWKFRGKWDETNLTLQGMRDKITDLAEYDRKLEGRLESHLAWHTRRQIGQ